MIKILKYAGIPLFIIIIVGGYFIFGRGKKPQYEFIIAKRSELIQEVSVTGRVKPKRHIGYTFEKSGKVSNLYVKVGDKVKAGAVLASLEHADLEAELAQAQASVDAAHAQLQQADAGLSAQIAKLEELKNGTRQEEIFIAQTKVATASTVLSDAQENLDNTIAKTGIDLKNLYDDVTDTLNDAYTKADDALNKQIEQLVTTAGGNSPQLTFYTTDPQAEVDAEFLRAAAGNSLKSFKQELNVLPSDNFGLDDVLIKAKNHLITVKKFLIRTDDALIAAAGVPVSLTASYKGNLIAAAVNVNAALSNINNQMQIIALQKIINQNNIAAAQTQLNGAQNSFSLAQAELDLKNAGATETQIAAQKAQVAQAQANIKFQKAQIAQAQANQKNIKAQINKTIIVSSINGIVTRTEIEVGETAPVNVPVILVISDEEFKLEAFVSEADIAKVKTEKPATVTLDAYGDDVVLTAKVTVIDPAETMLEGIATYKTTLKFNAKDGRLKSGMTANIDIETAHFLEVFAVPQRAVITKDENKIIRVLIGEDNKEEIKEVVVKTGIRSSDGNIEIIEGLAEGDKVVVSEKED